MNKPIRAKKHRLPLAAYRGQKAVAFTCCVQGRNRAFDSREAVQVNADILFEASSKHGCGVLIYCFMPDHLHTILRGLTPESNPKCAMDAFKYESGLWLHRTDANWTWQIDYYDHIVRSSEDLSGQVRYIAANPVRAQIVGEVLDYPFTGSGMADLAELLLDLEFDHKFGSRP